MLSAADCDVTAGSFPGSVFTATDRTLDHTSVLQHALLESNGWVTLEEVLSMLPEFRQEEVKSTIDMATSKNLCEVKFTGDGTKFLRALGVELKVARVDEIEVLPIADAPPADDTLQYVSMVAPRVLSEDLVVFSATEAPTQVASLSPPPPGLVGDADTLVSTSPQTLLQSTDLGNTRYLQNGESDSAKTGTACECVSVDGVAKVDDRTATREEASSTSSGLRSTARGHGTSSPAASVSSVGGAAVEDRSLVSESRDAVAVAGETKSVSALECGPLKCANHRCRYLVHSSSDVSWPFCCGRCWCRHTGVMRGRAAHGEFCERREAGPSAVAAHYTPTEDDLAVVAEAAS